MPLAAASAFRRISPKKVTVTGRAGKLCKLCAPLIAPIRSVPWPQVALDFLSFTQLTLTPLELIDRLAKFIPLPRRHLHRYHGVFAPHAKLRGAVAEWAGEAVLRAGEPLPLELFAGKDTVGLGAAGPNEWERIWRGCPSQAKGLCDSYP